MSTDFTYTAAIEDSLKKPLDLCEEACKQSGLSLDDLEAYKTAYEYLMRVQSIIRKLIQSAAKKTV